jgi:hypothetical protein
VLPEAAVPVLFNIRQTMTAFEKRYHLPPVDLRRIRAPGYTGPVSGADSEEVEDAEIVPAIAPGRRSRSCSPGCTRSSRSSRRRSCAPPVAGTSFR